MRKGTFAALFLTAFTFATSFGQRKAKNKQTASFATRQQTELYKEIFMEDSTLFYAFNHCDSVEYKKHLADDLEFYHDLGGLHFLTEEMQSIKEMCDRQSHIRRELVRATLEVHKLGNDGAVEIGVHRIYHTNKGETEHVSGDYKFIHVWQKEDGVWKLKEL